MKYEQLAQLLAAAASAASQLHRATSDFYDKENIEQCKLLEDSLSKMDAQDIAKIQNALRTINDRISLSTKSLNTLYDNVRKRTLPIAMEDQDLDLFSVPEVGKITLESDIYLSVPKANQEEFYDWLEENGHGDLIKSKIEHGTLKAWVKNYLKRDTSDEDYVPLPDYIKIVPYSFSKITKPKPK